MDKPTSSSVPIRLRRLQAFRPVGPSTLPFRPFVCQSSLSVFLSPAFAKALGHEISFVCLSLCPSVRLSVCHKNFNLGHNFCTITDRALILGMCVPCVKTFPVVPCHDLDGDLWPSSRSNLLPSGGPQFSEFACLFLLYQTVDYSSDMRISRSMHTFSCWIL